MLDHILLHTEGGEKNLDVAAIYEWSVDRWLVFGNDDVPQIQQRVTQADWVSGFDLFGTDFPRLWGQTEDGFRNGYLFRNLSSRANCLRRRIAFGRGLIPDAVTMEMQDIDLASVAMATIGRTPAASANPANVPAAIKAGAWSIFVSFALDTAIVKANLVEFVERYGYVLTERGERLHLRGHGPRSPLNDSQFIGRR